MLNIRIGLATKSFRFFSFENHEKKRNDFVANPIRKLRTFSSHFYHYNKVLGIY